MPTIKSIQLVPGQLIIDRGLATEAPVVINLSDMFIFGTIAQRERQAEQLLRTKFSGSSDQFRVHIYSLTPFKFTMLVVDATETVTDGWWVGAGQSV